MSREIQAAVNVCLDGVLGVADVSERAEGESIDQGGVASVETFKSELVSADERRGKRR